MSTVLGCPCPPVRLRSVPTGFPHIYRAEPLDGARPLGGFQPGLFEGFLREAAEPARERGRSLAPLLQRTGLPNIVFHQLRHTAATILLLYTIYIEKKNPVYTEHCRNGTPKKR
jgi:hypothetical protein